MINLAATSAKHHGLGRSDWLAYIISHPRRRKQLMTILKLLKVGDSVGAVFPQELLTRLNVQLGDTLHVTETADGLRLTSQGSDFERQMDAAREVMRKNRDVLSQLAK